MKQLILASGSPGRREFLQQAGVPFIVDISNYEEDMTLKMEPAELAMHLSEGKARDVAAQHKNAVVLAADSFAVFNGQLLGKPHTLARAKEMLQMLSGQCHSFITGFMIVDTDSGKTHSDSDETKVYMRKLTSDEIDGYLAKEDVLERAAAYRIQNLGAVLVEKIEGNYSNVIGLPFPKVAKALHDFGIEIL